MRTGAQVPRLSFVPEYVSNHAADDVIEMARVAGMPLDPWQEWVARNSLGELDDERWAAFEAALIVPRQCGKSALIQALIMAALIVWREQTVIYSAHLFATAQETFMRLRALFENSEFADEVAKVYTANGKESIILKNGCRVKFMARSRGGGRGFSGDRIIFDEAYDLSPQSIGAMVPTLAARSMRGESNPQIWYASSAPHVDSVVLHAIRKRAQTETPGRLFFAEWSAPADVDPDDVDAWYQANPALGIRIAEDFVRDERAALMHSPHEFLRERLGVPDEPPSVDGPEPKLDPALWQATVTADRLEPEPGACVFAFDIHRDWCSVAIGMGTLGAPYVEITDYRTGDGWLPNRIVELVMKYRPAAIGLDGASGAAVAVLGVIRERLEDNGLDPDMVRPLTTTAYRAACGGFARSVADGSLRRPLVNPDQLKLAGLKASERIVGDSWLWDRRAATVTLSPLIAATVARSLLSDKQQAEPEPFYVY